MAREGKHQLYRPLVRDSPGHGGVEETCGNAWKIPNARTGECPTCPWGHVAMNHGKGGATSVTPEGNAGMNARWAWLDRSRSTRD